MRVDLSTAAACGAAQKAVSFPTDDGSVVYADVYGEGDRGIVLAHGGPFKFQLKRPTRKGISLGVRAIGKIGSPG
jgi:hypothetical protein